MTGTDIALILTAFTGLVGAVFAGVAALMAARTAAALAKVKATVETIQTATDGMKNELVKVTGRAERAEGHAEGRADEKAEVAANAVVEGTVVEIPVHTKEVSKHAAAKAVKKS